MYICTHIYMEIYVYLDKWLHKCVFVHVYSAYVCIAIAAYICMFVIYMYLYIYVAAVCVYTHYFCGQCMNASEYLCVYMHIYVFVHVYTHEQIYRHTHTCACVAASI